MCYTSPNDKIIVWSELKAFSDEKLNDTEIVITVSDRIENVRIGENVGYTTMFTKDFDIRVEKSQDCVLIHYHTIPHFDALKIY